MTINHTPPAKMQPVLLGDSSEYVMAQVRIWQGDMFSARPSRGVLIHAQAAMTIASWLQSPGPEGIGMAQFASTGTVTDALLDDIERERGASQDAYKGAADTAGRTEALDNIAALRALDAYVRAATVPVWAVGANIAGYLPERDVQVALDYAEAVDDFRTLIKEAPEELIPDDQECTCVDEGESCDFHSLEAQVGAFIRDEVPWTITPSTYAVNPHQGEPRELSIALRPDHLPLPIVYWLSRSERVVADYIRERNGE